MLSRRVLGLLALALPLSLALPALAALLLPPRAEAADAVDMAAARREGTVSWYTSTPVATAQKIAALFEQQTGIKVQLFRSGGSAVVRRFMQEAEAGRFAADVITTSDPAASEAMTKKGYFVAFKPKNFDRVPAEVKHPDGYYIAQRLNVLGIEIHTEKVPPAERPKAWTDLTDPRYKGKMVMPDPSFTALQLMAVGTLSRKYGWEFYQKLKANDTMIVQSHQQVADTIKRGERVIAAESLDSYTYDDRKGGHPVQTLFPADGALVISSPTAIVKGGPNPNAAKAFAEFMIGDAVQGLFPGEGIYAARADMPPPAGNPPIGEIKIMPLDYEYLEKESQNIKARFNEIFQ